MPQEGHSTLGNHHYGHCQTLRNGKEQRTRKNSVTYGKERAVHDSSDGIKRLNCCSALFVILTEKSKKWRYDKESQLCQHTITLILHFSCDSSHDVVRLCCDTAMFNSMEKGKQSFRYYHYMKQREISWDLPRGYYGRCYTKNI